VGARMSVIVQMNVAYLAAGAPKRGRFIMGLDSYRLFDANRTKSQCGWLLLSHLKQGAAATYLSLPVFVSKFGPTRRLQSKVGL
jgi:hypothetical protein